jgi:hypothetical protein
MVPRHARIRYRGFDEKGNPIDRSVSGFHARVVQHECDHLLGILYPMRIRDFSKFGFIQALFPGEDILDECVLPPAGRWVRSARSAVYWCCNASSRSLSSCSTVLELASAAPEIRNTSSARSPRVTILAVIKLMLYLPSTSAIA